MALELPIVYFNGYSLTAEKSLRVNWSRYKAVTVFLRATALNGTPSAETLDCKLQDKFPREGTGWADISAMATTQITQADSLPITQRFRLTEALIQSEDMQLVVTPAFTGSTAWTVDLYAQPEVGD